MCYTIVQAHRFHNSGITSALQGNSDKSKFLFHNLAAYIAVDKVFKGKQADKAAEVGLKLWA